MSYNQNNQGNPNNGQQRDSAHLYTFMNTTILGRIVRDPETKTNNGGTFHEFAVAINHQNGETTFVDISVKDTNTFLSGKIKFLTKGRNILITGVLQIKPKGEGKVGSYVSLRPDHIQFVDNPSANGGAQTGGQQQQQQQQYGGQQQTPFSGGQPQQGGFQPQQQAPQQYAPQGGMPPQQGGFPQGGQQMPFNQQQQYQQPPQGQQQQPFGAPPVGNPFQGAPARG